MFLVVQFSFSKGMTMLKYRKVFEGLAGSVLAAVGLYLSPAAQSSGVEGGAETPPCTGKTGPYTCPSVLGARCTATFTEYKTTSLQKKVLTNGQTKTVCTNPVPANCKKGVTAPYKAGCQSG